MLSKANKECKKVTTHKGHEKKHERIYSMLPSTTTSKTHDTNKGTKNSKEVAGLLFLFYMPSTSPSANRRPFVSLKLSRVR